MIAKALITGLALWGACLALPVEKEDQVAVANQASPDPRVHLEHHSGSSSSSSHSGPLHQILDHSRERPDHHDHCSLGNCVRSGCTWEGCSHSGTKEEHYHHKECHGEHCHESEHHSHHHPREQVLPVNGGCQSFYFGPVGSVTRPMTFTLFCPGMLRLTDYYCSGDSFAVYDNGIFLGNTSRPVFNHCASNTTDPDYAFLQSNWSHGEFQLMPGFHNITVRVLTSPYNMGYGAIRVDADCKERERERCTLNVCPITRDDLVVVNTTVPRCQAESVCRALGMHLANIDIDNFLDATTLAFQCAGPFSQSWIDDWNGDKYMGTCLVLSTGAAAPGGAINVPNCCTIPLPVICQRKPCTHPPVHHSCHECHESCYCHEDKCHECRDRHCEPCKTCLRTA